MLQIDPRVAISPTPRSYVVCSHAPRSTHLLLWCWLPEIISEETNKEKNFLDFTLSMILILPSSLQFSLESLILTTLDAALGEWNLNYNVWSHMICATDPPQSVGLTFMTPVLWLCMDAFWFNIIISPMAQMPGMYFWVSYDRRWSGSVKSRPLSSLLPA